MSLKTILQEAEDEAVSDVDLTKAIEDDLKKMRRLHFSKKNQILFLEKAARALQQQADQLKNSN